jgi:hypothetical protein
LTARRAVDALGANAFSPIPVPESDRQIGETFLEVRQNSETTPDRA